MICEQKWPEDAGHFLIRIVNADRNCSDSPLCKSSVFTIDNERVFVLVRHLRFRNSVVSL